jgi:hypothetical protein
MDRLGLTEDELCRVLGVDPLSVIAGDLDDKPQLPILLALTEEAAERVGEDVVRRWVRASGPRGRPVEHLLGGDYAAFEDDLAALSERGFVLRGSGGGPAGGGAAGGRPAGAGPEGAGPPWAGPAGGGAAGGGAAGGRAAGAGAAGGGAACGGAAGGGPAGSDAPGGERPAGAPPAP